MLCEFIQKHSLKRLSCLLALQKYNFVFKQRHKLIKKCIKSDSCSKKYNRVNFLTTLLCCGSFMTEKNGNKLFCNYLPGLHRLINIICTFDA